MLQKLAVVPRRSGIGPVTRDFALWPPAATCCAPMSLAINLSEIVLLTCAFGSSLASDARFLHQIEALRPAECAESPRPLPDAKLDDVDPVRQNDTGVVS